jgi:hypothetical protein
MFVGVRCSAVHPVRKSERLRRCLFLSTASYLTLATVQANNKYRLIKGAIRSIFFVSVIRNKAVISHMWFTIDHR